LTWLERKRSLADAGGAMDRIFLSYARADHAVAEHLANLLASHGYRIWWDRHLVGGEEFAEEIERELERAAAVVVVWSATSVKSRWVRDEASVAGDSGRLVPVTIDETLPPMGFRQFQSVDMAGWTGAKDAKAAALVAAVERRLATDPKQPSSPALAPSWSSPAGRPRLGRPAIVAAIAMTLALAAGLYLVFFRDRGPTAADTPVFLLLPITTASNDPSLRELASQVGNSIAHRLSQSDLQIQQVASAPRQPGTAGDYKLSGEVSKSGDLVIATIRLEDAAHGVTVFSKRFEGKNSDLGDFAERVGVQIAGSVAWAAPLMALEKRHPSPPAVLADLIGNLDFTSDQPPTFLTDKRAAERAPQSAYAQVNLAMNTGIYLTAIPKGERQKAIAEASKSAVEAMKLAPEFGDVHAAWCMLHSETFFAECEDRLREGKRIDPGAPFVDAFLSGTMRQVGRFEEAVELTRLNYAQDPYVPTKISMILQAYEFSNEPKEAQELYAKAIRWWPEFQGSFLIHRAMGKFSRSDWDGLKTLFEESRGVPLPPFAKGLDQLASAPKSNSGPVVNSICASDVHAFTAAFCVVILARLGDPDRAYALAEKAFPRRVGATRAQTGQIWLNQPESNPTSFLSWPVAASLRRDPRFLELAQRVGLQAYWQSGRLPDFCKPPGEPVCAQFRRR
jgi:TolB-like protein/tetratricopeptide (TPR) repeat protein